MITIQNDGQRIANTNYWQSPQAAKGYCYLSWNAGAARVLVPRAMEPHVTEMKTGEFVVISRGRFEGRDALELMFEDQSDAPYCLHIVAEQCDRVIPDTEQGAGFAVAVWTEAGKQLELPGRYRTVDQLPCMQEWVEQ